MDKSTLKRIRLLAPGIIVLVCLLPLINLLNFKSITDRLPSGVILVLLTFIAQIIGGIYYGFDVRDLLWRSFVRSCRKNVSNKFSSINYYSSLSHKQTHILCEKQAMRIFYNIIDNNPSLQDQAHDVRLNGTVLTTIIDAIIIVGFFFVVYFIVFFISTNRIFLWSAITAVS